MPDPTASSTEAATSSEPKSKVNLIKGCGCTVGLLGLALGILIIGNFDSGAWASALGAIVIGVLVFNLSGVNGFWEK
jgi:hypothetical protein